MCKGAGGSAHAGRGRWWNLVIPPPPAPRTVPLLVFNSYERLGGGGGIEKRNSAILDGVSL